MVCECVCVRCARTRTRVHGVRALFRACVRVRARVRVRAAAEEAEGLQRELGAWCDGMAVRLDCLEAEV